MKDIVRIGVVGAGAIAQLAHLPVLAKRVNRAPVNGRRHALRPGRLLLIERDDRHEIRNTGEDPLKTLNFYVPPAYSSDGDELRPAKPGEGSG